MSKDFEKDAYPIPPTKTPVLETKTVLPNPAIILSKLFYYSIDLPISTLRGAIESVKGNNGLVYYHQKFRRVPYLTECVEGDYVCYYEAEMQWRRDQRVNREILSIVQSRLQACRFREGESADQNCTKELKQFEDVSRNYQICYGDLGAQPTARRCLMKQKQRMMEEQAQTV